MTSRGSRARYPLNSRLVKRGGQLVEEVYRADGKYGPEIRRIIGHLQSAAKVAPEAGRKALEALVTFYQTGAVADREAYDIAWVRDKDAPVDTVNGFVEVYMDPRGVKGSWEAIVSYVNTAKTGGIKKLAAEAQWFEDHMPWDARYRKSDVRGITANAIEVVIETGDCGPITPIGINLPNDQAIREQYGSKSVSLANVIEASDKSTPTEFRREFSWTPDEAARATRWSVLGNELLVNMHEVIGHASGKVSEGLRGKPQDTLKEQYSALEEGRADLVALYFMPDPKLAELGLVAAADQAEVARAAYESYARNGLVQLRRIKQGTQLEEDHMREPPDDRALADRPLEVDRRPNPRRQDLLRRDRRARVSRRRRQAARRGPADQVGRRLPGREGPLRDPRHPLRRGTPRRGCRPRGQAEPAFLHRVRHAQARCRHRCRRHDSGRPDLLPSGPDRSDARVYGFRAG